MGLISKTQREYINFLKHSNVIYANATKYIPHIDNSVDVVYSCHMLEHLTKNECRRCLTHKSPERFGIEVR